MKKLKNIDYILLFVVLLMTGFGLIMIFSASSASTVLRYGYSSSYFFLRQLLFLIISLVGGILVFIFPKKWYKIVAVIGIVGIALLLLSVLVSGHVSGNASSWKDIAGQRFQPSEFAKTIMIIFIAEYYGIAELIDRKLKKNQNGLLRWIYAIPLVIAIVLFFLIFRQPDLGSAIIFAIIVGFTYLCNPNTWRHFKVLVMPVLVLVALAIIAIPIVWNSNAFLSEEQKSRFDFFRPCAKYVEDGETGFQVCNSLIAMNSGGLLGRGLGESTQKYLYLPESHTDMIFPIIVEECGVISGALVILGYMIILIRIYRIANNADNTRDRLLGFGTLWFFATHIIINLFGVLSLMPLTGVPLPFLTYGGSFLVNAFILIFIVERINVDTKERKFQRELKKIKVSK